MSDIPITQRITRTIIRHRKDILALFLLIWSLLLASLMAFWIFDIAVWRGGLSREEYLLLNGIFLAYTTLTQLSLIGGYLFYRRRRSLVPFTAFLFVVSLLALVPIWASALS